MRRLDAVALVVSHLDDRALVVACNGFIGRELFHVRDRPSHFYMIGSMGLAASIGLGLALRRPERQVVVLDGDGNVFMAMGALANVAHAAPPNLLHVVFDNGVHASTGGQRTVADTVPLESVAAACGYRRVSRVFDREGTLAALSALTAGAGPSMLLVKVDPGDEHGIGRVTLDAPAIADRFRSDATGRREATSVRS